MTILLPLLASAFAEPRITQGTDAAEGEYPNVVLLVIEGASGNGTCTGSLIHERWVLTAAHCFDAVDLAENPSGNVTVRFGNQAGEAELIVQSVRAIVHPDYVGLPSGGTPYNGLGSFPTVPGYTDITNDVALVELATPVSIAPMLLNRAPLDSTWLGRDTTLVGFGITTLNGADSGTKRTATAPISAYSEAWPAGNGSFQTFDLQTRQGTCQGDSGSPSVIFTGGSPVQVGLATFYSNLGCGSGMSPFMRVDLYHDWIQATAGIGLRTIGTQPLSFACSHQNNPSPTSIAIGVVPMTLQCAIGSRDPETIETVTWSWGDGSPRLDVEGGPLSASHTYASMGVFNVGLCITGTRGTPEQPIPYEECLVKTDHVNACDVPEARFEATLDGLQVELRNTTSLRAHNCVSDARWDVFAGPAMGEPLLSLAGWEPELDLEPYGAGDYTIVLNVGGLAGTGAASAVVPVGRAAGCSTTGAPLLGGLLVLPLLAGIRRRA